MNVAHGIHMHCTFTEEEKEEEEEAIDADLQGSKLHLPWSLGMLLLYRSSLSPAGGCHQGILLGCSSCTSLQ